MPESLLCPSGDGEIRIPFTDPAARLPVACRNGRLAWLAWGRREAEKNGDWPAGGWAALEAIHAGDWDRWFPLPVRIVARGFMERDVDGRSHWFEVCRGKSIQGLVARRDHDRRVYVVTIAPEMPAPPIGAGPGS